METPVQRCRRIAAALEDLVEQEAAALANADWAGATALQDRADPLIDCLTTHAGDHAVRVELCERISALHARRSQTSAQLAREIERTRNELQHTQVVRMRVAQIAPAYGNGGATVHRLQVVG